MNPKRVRLVIRGHVQGVGFRYSAQERAQALGLTGWVRNLPTGEVEAEAEGAPVAVDGFVTWCQTGPPGAQVSALTNEELPASGTERDFQIRRGRG